MSKPVLLDANPGTATMTDAALSAGRTFSFGGVTVKLHSRTESTCRVEITGVSDLVSQVVTTRAVA